jgi:hypothetical protein
MNQPPAHDNIAANHIGDGNIGNDHVGDGNIGDDPDGVAADSQRPVDVCCQQCGRRPDPETPTAGNGLPWTWSFSTDDRQRRTVLCQDCTRQNARNIEARLDEDWW